MPVNSGLYQPSLSGFFYTLLFWALSTLTIRVSSCPSIPGSINPHSQGSLTPSSSGLSHALLFWALSTLTVRVYSCPSLLGPPSLLTLPVRVYSCPSILGLFNPHCQNPVTPFSPGLSQPLLSGYFLTPCPSLWTNLILRGYPYGFILTSPLFPPPPSQCLSFKPTTRRFASPS